MHMSEFLHFNVIHCSDQTEGGALLNSDKSNL